MCVCVCVCVCVKQCEYKGTPAPLALTAIYFVKLSMITCVRMVIGVGLGVADQRNKERGYEMFAASGVVACGVCGRALTDLTSVKRGEQEA